MSSPPDDKRVPGWRQPWDTWRIVMFAGSLVLLGMALSRVGGEERLPDWASVAGQVVGYGLLAYGFFLAMKTRREIKEKRLEAEKKGAIPRDRG